LEGFGNSVHSADANSLPVKISKITKEKHVLHFRLSRQKHVITHVNRLKKSRNYTKSRAEEERKKSRCAPSPDFLATPLAKIIKCDAAYEKVPNRRFQFRCKFTSKHAG